MTKHKPDRPRHRHKKPPPPAAQPSEEQMIEAYRDEVLDLESRGYLPTAIAAVIHIPYRLVEKILHTPAKPKKRS